MAVDVLTAECLKEYNVNLCSVVMVSCESEWMNGWTDGSIVGQIDELMNGLIWMNKTLQG